MKRTTDGLIAQLANELQPVRPLRWRAGMALALAAFAMAAEVPVTTVPLSKCRCIGSVHISSVRKILSAKARLQGEKRSKVGHLASIFNAAGAFLSQKIATR